VIDRWKRLGKWVVATLVMAFAIVARSAFAQPASPATNAASEHFETLEGGETLAIEPSSLDPALIGKTIKRVDARVVGTRWQTKPALTGLVAGAVLRGDLVRRAIRKLVEEGGASTAAAEAVADGDGVDVTVVVVPRRFVAGFLILGGDFDKNQTIHATGLAVDDEVTEASLGDVEKKVAQFYASHGYTDAHVVVRPVDVDAPLHVLLAIDIAPGTPRTFAQRVFVIDPLEDKEVGDLKRSYNVKSGDRLDETELEQADRDLADALRKAGFYKAEVSHAAKSSGPVSKLYVYIKSASRLASTFDGNVAFDADQLGKALAAGDKGFSDVDDAVARIKRYYVEYGFYDVEVTGELKREEGRAVDTLALEIRENRRVRVDKRIYSCLPKDIDPNSVGDEIDSFLESELPADDDLAGPPPSVLDSTIGPTQFRGGRAEPLALSPASTFAPDTYAKALKHLHDLYLSRGYLNAAIGPIQVVRARCKSTSPPGECIEAPFPKQVHAVCATDATGVPVGEPALPDGMTCVPDRLHGIFCSPHITLRIPMNLGPRSILYDVVFEGNRTETDASLASLVGLTLGAPFSMEDVDAARTKIIEHYQDRGYAYADVKTSIEPSADRTRARLRFSIEEHDPVTVTEVIVRGAVRTDQDIIVERVTMKKGSLFSRKAARVSEERIAQLGPFASVSVGLEDPDVPDKQKRLIVTVTEHPSQYLDPRIGFSTGEGVRVALEYGHRNIGGRAISLTLRVQLSYLFDFMILDPQVAQNLGTLAVSERLERRNSAQIQFPEFGLGPLFALSIEGLDVRDNQRDYGLTRDSLGPTVTFRPYREIVTTLGATVELNDVQIFNADAVNAAIKTNPSLAQVLSFPQGRTVAIAQQLGAAWDRRDSPFAATKGTYASASIEHVDAFPTDTSKVCKTGESPATANCQEPSHFLRLQTRLAGYVRFTDKGVALAVSVAVGGNVQLTSTSETYPDRLFYLGGFDSLRSFYPDSVVPEDVAQRILPCAPEIRNDPKKCPPRLSINDVAVRGGDLSINPRIELRVPLTSTFAIGVFLDTGNLWKDPTEILKIPFALRYGAGAGLRIATPVGPLAFDYGFNLNRRLPLNEDVGALAFSIGLF